MDLAAGQTPIQVGTGGTFGGDAGLLFLGLMMMGMSGGWGGFGNRGPVQMPPMTGDQAPVSSAQFQNGMNMQSLGDQNRDILGAVNNVYHDTVAYVGDKYAETQRDIAALAVGQANGLARQNECCANITAQIAAQTLRQTEQLAALRADMVAQNQATRDLFTQSEMQRMRDQIGDLKDQLRDMNTVPFRLALHAKI